MACCAFIAFVIGQCLAAFQSWRNRLARLFGWKIGEGKPVVAPRWRRGLVVALVMELGIAAGGLVGAGLAHGDQVWSMLCRANPVAAAR